MSHLVLYIELEIVLLGLSPGGAGFGANELEIPPANDIDSVSAIETDGNFS